MQRVARWLVFVLLISAGFARADASRPADSQPLNAVLVLVDGLRTQEVFAGADEPLMTKDAGCVANPDELRRKYWKETPELRRAALMPFFWTVLAKQGQVFGNQAKGSIVTLANEHRFSYPGYSEMLVGYADPRIDSNDQRPNPNVTVLEWLNHRPSFERRVAAFGAWDTLAFIINRERCGFFVNAGFEPVPEGGNPRLQLLNQLKTEIPSPWDGEPHDALTLRSAIEYLRDHKPRVMLITLGETDEFGHEGHYDRYLDAAARTDNFLRTLWNALQSMPEYRDRTTLIVATDHGRGRTPADWNDHGAKIEGAQDVWIGLMGSRTPARGERSDVPPMHLAQVAATLAAAVGENYAAQAPTIEHVLPQAIDAK